MPNNVVSWFEIYVEDMERAKRFYESVFATTLEKIPNDELEMWMFPWQDGGMGAGGALAKMKGVNPGCGGTMVYFGCEDCAVEEARVRTQGGEVLQSKSSIGPHGFIAIVKDSEGNTIGLHSMK